MTKTKEKKNDFVFAWKQVFLKDLFVGWELSIPQSLKRVASLMVMLSKGDKSFSRIASA